MMPDSTKMFPRLTPPPIGRIGKTILGRVFFPRERTVSINKDFDIQKFSARWEGLRANIDRCNQADAPGASS